MFKRTQKEITTASIVTPFVELINKLDEHVANQDKETIRLEEVINDAQVKKAKIAYDTAEALAIAENLKKLFKQ